MKKMMGETEMMEAILIKNNLLICQARRIKILEEKITEWREKYFRLNNMDGNMLLKNT